MKKSILKMFFAVGVMVATFGDVAHAINTLSEGYQVLPGVATVIDTTPIGGDCKVVVTPNDGRDRFVPTKTLVEWNAFKSAAPGLGIALNPCITPFTLASIEGKYATEDWDFDRLDSRIRNGKLEIWLAPLSNIILGWIPLDVDPATLHAKWLSFLEFYIRPEGLYFSAIGLGGEYRYIGNGWCNYSPSASYEPNHLSPLTNCGCNADGTWGAGGEGCGWNYIHRNSGYYNSNPPPLNP